MMGNPWSKFFWSDWESDEGLRQCSLAAQGLWMRILCICAKSDRPGYLTIAGRPLDFDGVAKSTGADPSEVRTLMEELDQWGVFSRDREGRIYSRRMVREAKRSQEGRKHAKKGWAQHPEHKGKIRLPKGVPKGVPSTHKPEARYRRVLSSVSTDRILPLRESESNDTACAREAILLDEFEAWWERFPRYRRGAKGPTKKKWFSLIRRHRATVDELNTGLDRYLAAGYAKSEFACGALTFLNGEKWTIDKFPPASDTRAKDRQREYVAGPRL